MSSWSPGAEKKKRRSQRVMLALPVTVSGVGTDGAFSEETQTMVVNAHGALITLEARVPSDAKLRLKTRLSQDEKECRVTYVGPTTQGRTQLGVEFTTPSPNFWHIAFPPEDWTSPLIDPPVLARSKAPTPAKSKA